MKNNLLVLLILVCFTAFSQSTTIEPGGITPKMTTSERTSLSSPTDGLLVFDQTTQSYWYRSSGIWVEINGSGSGTPAVPQSLPKVQSKYLAISLPNEDIFNPKMEISDNGTICLGYMTTAKYFIVLRRNNAFERFSFNRGNSVDFKFVINASNKILMAYDSTASGYKRMKYRMFDGTSWGAVGTASPDYSSITTFDLCLNDNSRAFIAWNQPDAVTSRVFLSTYDGSSWSHPSTYFNYFNPDWGTSSNAYATSQVNIDIAANNNALITWHQNTPNSHAFKAEYLSGAWQKPASALDFIEDRPDPSYGLTNVKSILAADGSALVSFSYYKTTTYDIYIDYYYSYNCNVKILGTWTNKIFLSSYFQPDGGSSFESFNHELIATKTNGVYVYMENLTSGAGSYSGSRRISKVISSGLVHNYLSVSGYNLLYHFPVSADLNSDSSLLYGIMHEINVVKQVFELFQPLGNVVISAENSSDYLNEYTGSTPNSIIGRMGENNRTRAISWIQQENSKNRLYMSFID